VNRGDLPGGQPCFCAGNGSPTHVKTNRRCITIKKVRKYFHVFRPTWTQVKSKQIRLRLLSLALGKAAAGRSNAEIPEVSLNENSYLG
jgi:hypothetical protein